MEREREPFVKNVARFTLASRVRFIIPNMRSIILMNRLINRSEAEKDDDEKWESKILQQWVFMRADDHNNLPFTILYVKNIHLQLYNTYNYNLHIQFIQLYTCTIRCLFKNAAYSSDSFDSSRRIKFDFCLYLRMSLIIFRYRPYSF